MAIDSRRILHQLGRGESIDDVRAAAGLTEAEFEAWWNEELQRRLAVTDGRSAGPVGAAVEIQRDVSGLAHIYAEEETDLFVGYGYAMAQDRLFQMDYLRRRALGRLAEILGPEAFDYDLLVRTVGLHRIAADETARLPAETAARYEAFADGVNAFIEECRDLPPIEFDLLDYRPEPWRPLDSIALLGEFRWYLTGRFPVIAVPELARRALGEGAALPKPSLTPEAIDETILHPGEYASAGSGTDPVEPPLGGIDDGTGSNNWVVGPSRSVSGGALVVSDPHIAFGSPCCWYQAHLVGGRFNMAGAGYAGAPGIIFGRNRRVAWGITNNISSQRDLYQERTDPAHPGAFLYDGKWEPARERVESISVRSEGVREEVVRSSRNGPIVDRHPAGICTRHRAGFAAMGRGAALRLADGAAGVEPGRLLRRARGCPAGLGLADAEHGARRRGRRLRLSGDGPGADPNAGGTRLPARVGPRRCLAGHDPVRGHARGARPRARLDGNGEQPAGAVGLSVSAGQHVAERLPRATHPADDRGAGSAQP